MVAAHLRPRSSRGRSQECVFPAAGLAILWRVLALAIGILLLLARLLAATLLLAGLLTRVLVLLSRILVLVGHSQSPLLNVVQNKPPGCAIVSIVAGFHLDL
jgi:hypothetical protein